MEQWNPDAKRNVQSKAKDPQQSNSVRALNNGDGNTTSLTNESETRQSSSAWAALSDSATKKSVRWNPELVKESFFVVSPQGSPRYFYSSPFSSPSFSVKDKLNTVLNVLEKWGRRVGEATKKAETLTENTWVHFRTNTSFTEAAVGRIARGTKIFAEGGHENIFRQTFESAPGERVTKAYACYASTSLGAVMGVLYVSNIKVAYCSDSPLSYQDDSETEWRHYKVIIPLRQLKSVLPSSNRFNPAEKYIQLVSADNQKFWFMGFLNYDGALECLTQVSQPNDSQIDH